jgi:hypothetical protein
MPVQKFEKKGSDVI